MNPNAVLVSLTRNDTDFEKNFFLKYVESYLRSEKVTEYGRFSTPLGVTFEEKAKVIPYFLN